MMQEVRRLCDIDREWVRFEDIAPIIRAAVAAEDANFVALGVGYHRHRGALESVGAGSTIVVVVHVHSAWLLVATQSVRGAITLCRGHVV